MALLWALYCFYYTINDLPNVSNCLQFVCFSDDTNVSFLRDTNYENLFKVMKVVLVNVSIWFRANKLFVNLSKTNLMLFHTKKPKCSIR